MAELVDATDLKSVEVYPRAGSIPASGTTFELNSLLKLKYLKTVLKLSVRHILFSIKIPTGKI